MKRYFLYKPDSMYIVSKRGYRSVELGQLQVDKGEYELMFKTILHRGEYEQVGGQLLSCYPEISKLKYYPGRDDFIRGKKKWKWKR